MDADRGERQGEVTARTWFRDRNAWRVVARGYLPWLAGANLVWEVAQMPLYTLWREANAAYIAFAIVHCTLGDVIIGAAALLLALVVVRQWRWRRLAVLTALFGAGYTVFSEWMNVTILRSWSYTLSMPTLELPGFELGLTPFAQWLVVPPLALYVAVYFGRSSKENER